MAPIVERIYSQDERAEMVKKVVEEKQNELSSSVLNALYNNDNTYGGYGAIFAGVQPIEEGCTRCTIKAHTVIEEENGTLTDYSFLKIGNGEISEVEKVFGIPYENIPESILFCVESGQEGEYLQLIDSVFPLIAESGYKIINICGSVYTWTKIQQGRGSSCYEILKKIKSMESTGIDI